MKLKISEIKPNPNNPRLIKDDKFKKLVKSIQEFEEMLDVRPIVVNKEHVILGGNMRYKAMIEAGIKEIPVTVVDWSEEKQREFIIKDNVSGGEWDWDLIANEWDSDLLDDWGLDLPAQFGDEEVEEDEAPEVSSEPPVSKLGEVYQLGRHRVMCGDSTDKASVELLMNGSKADMVFTDPPYGISIDNKNGKILGDSDLVVFENSLPLIKDYSKDDAHIYIYFGVQLISDSLKLLNSVFKQTNLLVQRVMHENKPSPDGYFKSNYELCYFSNGGRSFNKGLTDVSETTLNDSRYTGNGKSDTYLALTDIKSTEHNLKSVHPTQKSIEICAFYQKISSNRDNIILDLFLGSGSTLIACEQTDRTCYGMELDPKYVDVIRKRYAKYIGEENWEAATPVISERSA